MSEKELTDLIERIKERRLKLEMSYQDLSDATGISKSTLQRYETGYIKKVPINQIEILAHIRLFTVIILVLIIVQFFVQ